MKPLTAFASFSISATFFFGTVSQAVAINFNFSFSNEEGPVSGAVAGTIVLPDGDGTFAATGITVTSAPVALGYTLPFDVLANLTTVTQNTFTVTGGAIDPVASSFYAFFSPDAINGSAFGLSATNPPGFVAGSSFSVQLSSNPSTGVIDSDNSTLTFTPATPVPLETDDLPLVFSGLFIAGGVWFKRKRSQAKLSEFLKTSNESA